MNKKMKAFMWYERVILRGIEGIISDRFLGMVATDETYEEAMQNHFEAKNMAEAVYCETRGWVK